MELLDSNWNKHNNNVCRRYPQDFSVTHIGGNMSTQLPHIFMKVSFLDRIFDCTYYSCTDMEVIILFIILITAAAAFLDTWAKNDNYAKINEVLLKQRRTSDYAKGSYTKQIIKKSKTV